MPNKINVYCEVTYTQTIENFKSPNTKESQSPTGEWEPPILNLWHTQKDEYKVKKVTFVNVSCANSSFIWLFFYLKTKILNMRKSLAA